VLANDSFTHNPVYLRDLFKSLVLCVQKEQKGSVMNVASPTERSLFTAPCSMQYDYGNCPPMWSILMELLQQAMVHSLWQRYLLV